jgi:hypothetical protein
MAKRVKIQGVSLTIATGVASGQVDYQLDQEKEFHGVRIAIQAAVFGDEIDLQIILPIGHPSNPTQEEVIAYDYASDAKLTAGAQTIDVHVYSKDEHADIPSGSILRFRMIPVDTLGRQAQVWYRFKQ